MPNANTSNRIGLRLVKGAIEAPDPTHEPESGRAMAVEVAAAIGANCTAPPDATLALPLALSVCMARHGEAVDGLVGAMRLVRSALLSISTLDETDEPVPLAAGDPRSAALGFARYLTDLVHRASRATGVAAEVIASSAAAHLAAA